MSTTFSFIGMNSGSVSSEFIPAYNYNPQDDEKTLEYVENYLINSTNEMIDIENEMYENYDRGYVNSTKSYDYLSQDFHNTYSAITSFVKQNFETLLDILYIHLKTKELFNPMFNDIFENEFYETLNLDYDDSSEKMINAIALYRTS